MKIRSADFAGSWYPGKESDCRKAIELYLKDNSHCPQDMAAAVGGIVPHAGWFYSGKIACRIINILSHRKDVDVCIIFGRHLHPGGNTYIMEAGAWETPFGNLEIDSDLASKLTEEFQFVIEDSVLYEHDNTIELQLPFIKYFLPDIKIVPIGVPPRPESLEIGIRAAEISRILGRKAIVVGSTDLTHYGANYGFAPKGEDVEAVNWVKSYNDRRIIELMVKMDEKSVIRDAAINHNACCAGAAATAISASRTLGAKRAEEIMYYTSYDLRAASSFVGYAGIVFYE